MADAPTLQPIVGGLLDLIFYPTGERSIADAKILRSADGLWCLMIWLPGEPLPRVFEGRQETPCADAVVRTMFEQSVRQIAGD